MKLQQPSVLKYVLDNQEWIPKVQPEIFYGELSSIFKIAKGMDANGIRPTIQSLQYALTKKEMPSEREALGQITRADEIDNSTFKLVLADLRKEARTRLVQTYGALGELDDKQFKTFNQRLAALLLEEEPEGLMKSVSFFDWNAHVTPVGMVVGSGLAFLENTGADFCKGHLIGLLAPSGNGKTTILTHVAKHLLVSKKNVLVIAFEETPSQYMTRVGMGLLNKTKYEYNQMHPEQIERELMNRFKNQFGNLDVISGASIFVEDLKDIVTTEETERGYVYDAVIIDYSRQLQLRKSKKNNSTHEEIGDVFRELKKYAMTKGNEKLVITATQANREGYGNREISVTNIAESMGPLHNADMMIGIKRKTADDYQDRLESQERANDIPSIIKLTILKKREGSVVEGQTDYYTLNKAGNITSLASADKQMLEENWDNDSFQMVLNS